MENFEVSSEQRKVHVALSSFVASMVRSTALNEAVVNLPVTVPDDAVNEPRKYRPGPESAPVAPLDLSM